MSLENILDATLEDLADRPSIQLFPNGAHKATMKTEVDDKAVSVKIEFTYVDVVELSDPGALAPTAGDKNTVYFFLLKKDKTANEFNQGAVKEIVSALKEGGVEGTSTREILTNANGMEVVIVTKIRVGKGEYEGRDNLEINKLMVV